MYELEEILSRSASDNKIVLEYIDALELLYLFGNSNKEVLGWEGWIKYPDGSLGHSAKYQRTTDLSSMPNESAIALIQSSIMQAHSEWEEVPEVENAKLLFCIDVNT